MDTKHELKELTSLFPEGDALFEGAESVPAALVPEPYKRLLVHAHHMTLMMEEFHNSPVEVKVLDRKLDGAIYSRQTLLERSKDGRVVQFALVRFDLTAVSPAVRDEILSERIPLGRILINYNVFRHIVLGSLLQIRAGTAFSRLCGCATGQTTYGRLATIFCNNHPAVDLLEVSAPV